MQKEIARALGLLNEDAFWMPQTNPQAGPKATGQRRPGHTRRPFAAEDTASWGGEEHDTDDDLADGQPKAKRQRPASAADSLAAAPGEGPA